MLVGVEASGASRSAGKTPMYTLFSLVIPFVLINHGLNSIALKIISKIASGFKCWRETSKK
jgi:hypothetical protein